MAIDWKIAFPLHPEFRTLPMVWYVPPLSPIQAKAAAGELGINGAIPDVSKLRIPLRYLANLLTAGDEFPIKFALERLLAMRAYMRARHVDGVEATEVLEQVNLDRATVEDMYRILALAAYEDRFVIPTTHREYAENAYDLRGSCGFSFGNGCSGGSSDTGLFGKQAHRHGMHAKAKAEI
jgi:nitrate reductase / nitrite oxidoreductase, beta subunit